MGIPKYYRWISERYPCLSQVVEEAEIPQFDCLYLDMNGIIHNCTHANASVDLMKGWCEEDMFQKITEYIDQLFQTIKPCEIFYMAVDGCAPRAKMNQQRARRFRSAQEAAEAKEKAIREGKYDKDSGPSFDSNCITPGTPFMDRLEKHLRYFVQIKLDSDPLWQKCKVIFSGHNVPGEGEHKIMDFIRSERMKEDYNPNKRHCLYGLDADLIMLGLVTHEPHCSLLREEVQFGNKAKKTDTFHLLSLSLYREYLNLEFSDLKGKLKFEYDFERLLDDWILLGFFIGNDFLPHLPYFHIADDIVPKMYMMYKEVIKKLDGWITEGGKINMARLEKLLRRFDKIDIECFDELNSNLKYFGLASKLRKKAPSPDILSGLAVLNESSSDAQDDDEGDSSSSGGDDDDDVDSDEDENGLSLFDEEHLVHKRNYYFEKGFAIKEYDDAFKHRVAKEYALGLQWVYHYYYNGVPSWSWFYPSHYAPFVSDVIGIKHYVPVYELGEPLLPFQQLMAVLPPPSKDHVPAAYQPLMLEEDSPINDFYPRTFKLDLNGKKNDWEAVVLIPFIDEKRLLEAMATKTPHLTEEEQLRNARALPKMYYQDPTSKLKAVSPYPVRFGPRTTHVAFDELTCPHAAFPTPHLGLLPGYNDKMYSSGFPSFRHKKHTVDLKKAGVKVFNFESTSESFIIKPDAPTAADIAGAKALLGKSVWVRFPHLVESILLEIKTREEVFFFDKKTQTSRSRPLTPEEKAAFRRDSVDIEQHWLKTRGLEVGHVDVVLRVKKLAGFKLSFDSKAGKFVLSKDFSNRLSSFPLQLSCLDLAIHDDKLANQSALGGKQLKDVISAGNSLCYMGPDNYGSIGSVTKVGHVTVDIAINANPVNPPLRHVLAAASGVQYRNLYDFSRDVGMPMSMLNKIVSSIRVNTGQHDKKGIDYSIGAGIKFSKRQQLVPSYIVHNEGTYMLSPEGVQLLGYYCQHYRSVWLALQHASDVKGVYFLGDKPIPGVTEEVVKEMSEFLKQHLPNVRDELVQTDSVVLPLQTIKAVRFLTREAAKFTEPRTVTMTAVPMRFVKVQGTDVGRSSAVAGDPSTTFLIGDRIAAVTDTKSYSFGTHGTIVGTLGNEESSLLRVLLDTACPLTGNDVLDVPKAHFVSITFGARRAVPAEDAAALASGVEEEKKFSPASTSSSSSSSSSLTTTATTTAVTTAKPLSVKSSATTPSISEDSGTATAVPKVSPSGTLPSTAKKPNPGAALVQKLKSTRAASVSSEPSTKAEAAHAASAKTTADKATADKATADKATADKATADKATADKATADKATADKASRSNTPSKPRKASSSADAVAEVPTTSEQGSPARAETPPSPTKSSKKKKKKKESKEKTKVGGDVSDPAVTKPAKVSKTPQQASPVPPVASKASTATGTHAASPVVSKPTPKPIAPPPSQKISASDLLTKSSVTLRGRKHDLDEYAKIWRDCTPHHDSKK